MATKVDRPLVRRRHTVFPDRTLYQLRHAENVNDTFCSRRELAASFEQGDVDFATNQRQSGIKCCKKIEKCRSFDSYENNGSRENFDRKDSQAEFHCALTKPELEPSISTSVTSDGSSRAKANQYGRRVKSKHDTKNKALLPTVSSPATVVAFRQGFDKKGAGNNSFTSRSQQEFTNDSLSCVSMTSTSRDRGENVAVECYQAPPTRPSIAIKSSAAGTLEVNRRVPRPHAALQALKIPVSAQRSRTPWIPAGVRMPVFRVVQSDGIAPQRH